MLLALNKKEGKSLAAQDLSAGQVETLHSGWKSTKKKSHQRLNVSGNSND